MLLINLCCLSLLAGCTAATGLLCAGKWGWLQAWEVQRPAWLMRRCDFCAGFWLGLAVCGGACAAAGLPWWHLAAALPAAAVCRAVTGPL